MPFPGTRDAVERRPGFQLCDPEPHEHHTVPLPACFPICKMGPNMQPQGANQMRKGVSRATAQELPWCLQNKGGVPGYSASSVGTLRCGSRKTVLNGLLLPAQKTLPAWRITSQDGYSGDSAESSKNKSHVFFLFIILNYF